MDLCIACKQLTEHDIDFKDNFNIIEIYGTCQTIIGFYLMKCSFLYLCMMRISRDINEYV
jgi:hypothetical protein